MKPACITIQDWWQISEKTPAFEYRLKPPGTLSIVKDFYSVRLLELAYHSPPLIAGIVEFVEAVLGKTPSIEDALPPETPKDKLAILSKLKPSVRKAYFAFEYAVSRKGPKLTVEAAFSWLKENGIDATHGDLGELENYAVPDKLETFTRFLSTARKALGETKYSKRRGGHPAVVSLASTKSSGSIPPTRSSPDPNRTAIGPHRNFSKIFPVRRISLQCFVRPALAVGGTLLPSVAIVAANGPISGLRGERVPAQSTPGRSRHSLEDTNMIVHPDAEPDPTAQAGRAILVDKLAVAQLLNCSARHVSRLSDAGRMPSPVKLGALVRWSLPSIRAWIEAGCPAVSRKGGAR